MCVTQIGVSAGDKPYHKFVTSLSPVVASCRQFNWRQLVTNWRHLVSIRSVWMIRVSKKVVSS